MTNNTTKSNKGQLPFYDIENKNGYCQYCLKQWTLEQQIMYTTKNKTRTYGICPKCKNKHPLRKRPRTRDHWLKRHELKRIE